MYSKSDEGEQSFLLWRIRIEFIPLCIRFLDHLVDLFLLLINSLSTEKENRATNLLLEELIDLRFRS